jgi:predicted Rossmann-fold nucleotide-binding protein
MDAAVRVRGRFPLEPSPTSGRPPRSLGIPTWLYGHEPPTVFATHIAKYFANSVREEGLLAIAHHGVVFSPGSAGTIQEIFQDACQNHYQSFLFASPMIFLGKRFWTEEKPVFPLLERLARGHGYHALLDVTDDPETVVQRIKDFEPETPVA